jgi:hypothetical protein
MSPLHPSIRARIAAQIASKEATLVKANAAYDSALESSHISSYTFDGGEGKQQTFRRKPAEIRIEITNLETEIDSLYRRLGGTGVVNMTLRRGCR